MVTNSNDVDNPVPGQVSETSPEIPGGPELNLLPPPRRDWFTFRRTHDAILSGYVLQSLQMIRSRFDDYRDSAVELPGRVELVTLDEHLGLCLDLLVTAPSLSPSRREFRPVRQKVIQLLERLEQATEHLVEFATATDELRSHDPGSPEWSQVCGHLVQLLVQLEKPLRQRRELI